VGIVRGHNISLQRTAILRLAAAELRSFGGRKACLPMVWYLAVIVCGLSRLTVAGQAVSPVMRSEPPILIHRVEPVLIAGENVGRVVAIKAIISAAGRVTKIHVVKSVTPSFDARCVAALRQWRYRPAQINGEPISVPLTVTFVVQPSPI